MTMTHQFSLFGFVKPKSKLSVDLIAQMRAGKRKWDKKDFQGSVESLRALNDRLENYLKRIK